MCHFFRILRHIFCISQHFLPKSSALSRNIERFHRLFFRGINETQNLNEKRYMYSEFFMHREIICEILRNVSNDKCIAGLRAFFSTILSYLHNNETAARRILRSLNFNPLSKLSWNHFWVLWAPFWRWTAWEEDIRRPHI